MPRVSYEHVTGFVQSLLPSSSFASGNGIKIALVFWGLEHRVYRETVL